MQGLVPSNSWIKTWVENFSTGSPIKPATGGRGVNARFQTVILALEDHTRSNICRWSVQLRSDLPQSLESSLSREEFFVDKII